jgi:hypothetical protein
MKSAAIDCELNIKQNRDSTFKCLPLRGKVGDFLYHPDLDIDIRESASMYSIDEKGPGAAAPAAAAPTQKQDYIFKKLKDVIYRMREVRDPLTKEITGYQMYAKDDSDYKKLLGTAGAKDGMPAPPVKFIKA